MFVPWLDFIAKFCFCLFWATSSNVQGLLCTQELLLAVLRGLYEWAFLLQRASLFSRCCPKYPQHCCQLLFLGSACIEHHFCLALRRGDWGCETELLVHWPCYGGNECYSPKCLQSGHIPPWLKIASNGLAGPEAPSGLVLLFTVQVAVYGILAAYHGPGAKQLLKVLHAFTRDERLDED